MIQVCKKMIRSVLILHQGKCLVTQNYQTIDVDNIDLFSGFLSVANDFAKTMLNESLSELHLEHTKITYKSENDIIVAILTDQKYQIRLDDILNQLYYVFIHQYAEYLSQQIVNTSVFQSFKDTIDDILQESLLNHSATNHYSL